MTPETNSEGGYTLTKKDLISIRSWLRAAKETDSRSETFRCINEVLDLLPKRDRLKEGGA